jgi:hypothetical protein
MARSVSVSEQVLLPVPVEDAWAFLSDRPRMVALDPLLVAYEPERGVIEQGTLNRVTMRLGPLRLTSTSRTELLDPPHRVLFVSVQPARPVHVRTEDMVEPVGDGCRYTVPSTLTPTLPLYRHEHAHADAAAHRPARGPVHGRAIARSRRQLMNRLRSALAPAVTPR